MDPYSTRGMTEADLGSDFSDSEMEPDSTSDLGSDTVTHRYPSFFQSQQLSRNDGISGQFSAPSNFTTKSNKPTPEVGSRSLGNPVASPVFRPTIATAIEGQDIKSAKVISLDVLPHKYQQFFYEYSYFNIVQSSVYPDIMNTNNSLALCSPTGSGKTVVMELAIIKLLIDHDHCGNGGRFTHKIIYLSPLKGICNEKYRDWLSNFSALGLSVCEITGDSDEKDYSAVYKSNLIVTTPEKWDSMTRKWKKERQALMSSVKLVLIDEVHLLSENSRGPCLEAVITRIKTAKKDVRFIAVSATAPNIDDVATWLGRADLPGKYHKMGEEYRPVQLNCIVKGYNKYESNDFVFDKVLDKNVPQLVNEYSDSKPTLVFCMTRKSCANAAKAMRDASTLLIGLEHRRSLQLISDQIKDPTLKDLVLNGIAYHHAGVDARDRKLIEAGFSNSLILVLFCTSTLAQGMNFPAHLVVIKGTVRYGNMGTTDYSETEIQQMIGRAGRPQYDQSGVAIIMTSDKHILKYQLLVRGEKFLESHIHRNLPEHLNAEVVLETIKNLPEAIEWIRSTFYYIRCRKERCVFDGSNAKLSDSAIETRIKDNCVSELNGLTKHKMIKMDPLGYTVTATEVGKLMAYFYISFDTMKKLTSLKPNMKIAEVLDLVCSCQELTRESELRNEDKKFLFSFHGKSKDEPNRTKVRYPSSQKIKNRESKISTLLQIEFGLINEIQDGKSDPFPLKYKIEITKLLKTGKRLTRCLVDVAVLPEVAKEIGFQTVKSCITISKCFKNGLWETTPFVSKQFDGIGVKTAIQLNQRSLSTIEDIARCDPRVFDGMTNRRNNKIIELARRLPEYCLSATQVVEGPKEAKIELALSIKNWNEVSKNPTAGKDHIVYLLVGDSDGNLLICQKIKDQEMLSGQTFERTFEIQKSPAPKVTEIKVAVLSESWIGIDMPNVKFIVKSFPHFKKNVREPLLVPFGVPTKTPNECSSTVTFSTESNVFDKQDEPVTTEADSLLCKHKCSNKSSCKHECCKSGTKSARKKSRPVLVPSNNQSATLPVKNLFPVASSAATATIPDYFPQVPAKKARIVEEKMIDRNDQPTVQKARSQEKVSFLSSPLRIGSFARAETVEKINVAPDHPIEDVMKKKQETNMDVFDVLGSNDNVEKELTSTEEFEKLLKKWKSECS